MTSRAIALDPTNERAERYRSAERPVWSHYGLEPTERFVEFESPAVRLRIQEVGSGEPIVFAHGGLWPAVALAPLVRELAGYRCILLDRPGCGLSSPVDWRKHELRTVAPKLMGGVADALGLERTHVIGHSIGGVWALRLAQDQAVASRQDRDPGRFAGAGRNAAPGIFPDPGVANRSPHHPSSAKPGPCALDAPPGWAWPEPGCWPHPGCVLRLARRARPQYNDAGQRARHDPRCGRPRWRVATRGHLRARRAVRDPAAAPLRHRQCRP